MTILPFFHLSLYQMYFLFIVWSFIGWGLEVIVLTYETGEYQNRGFLNGPICPIYGMGVLMIVTVFRPIQGNAVVLFFGSMILCTVFELLVGLLLEALFHNRWWDYSHMRFNYKGLISLPASLFWGIGCVGAIRVVNPFFIKCIGMIPVKAGLVFIFITGVMIAIDTISSVKAVNSLNDKLKQLDIISKKMLDVSVAIGLVISDKTNDVLEDCDKIVQKTTEAAEKVSATAKEITSETKAELTEEYNELKLKYEDLLGMKNMSDRLIKAFPALKNKKYDNVLRDLKHKVSPKSTEHFEIHLDEIKRLRDKFGK